MSDLPARRADNLPDLTRTPTPREIYNAFLRGRNKNTLDAYQRDLKAFALYRSLDDGQVASEGLVAASAGMAHRIVLGWRNHMVEEGLAPATINRRLSTLRGFTKLARQMGLIAWMVEVENVRAEKYRDTAGPPPEKVSELLAHADAKLDRPAGTPKDVRDAAILHVLFGQALRRFELVNLDLAHVDFENSKLEITGKARAASEKVTMARPVIAALKRWIETRGTKRGPLFTSMDRARKGSGRLDGTSIRRIVRKLGKEVGLDLWPHALRHSSVTAVLDATDGDVRAAQRFARHRNINTTMLYDDNRKDLGGAAAEKMADYMDGLGEEEGQ
jgi:integrase/recombinase XerC